MSMLTMAVQKANTTNVCLEALVHCNMWALQITAGLKSLSQHIKSKPGAVPAVLQTLFYVF